MKQGTVIFVFFSMFILAFIGGLTFISSIPMFLSTVVMFATVTAFLLSKLEDAELNYHEKQPVSSSHH